MIKEFLEKYDFSHLPIGPQAELIESLDDLNRQVPWQFKDGGLSNYPNIEFGINKNFTWKYGTFKNAESVKNLLEGSYKHKGFKWGGIKNIWIRPSINIRSYTSQRFKNKIFNIETMLQHKRWNDEIWLDDKDKLDTLINTCIEDMVKIFDDYIKYIRMIDKDHTMDEGTDIIKMDLDGTDKQLNIYKMFMNDTIRKMWKFEDTTPKIILKNGSNLTNHSTITILHPFKDVMMNVYVVEETNPIFTFPIGHVIGSYSCNIESLIYSKLGVSSNRYSRSRYIKTKFWFKPHIQGVLHPFIQYPHIRDSTNNSWRYDDPVNWPIDYHGVSNICVGNIDIVNGDSRNINIIDWVENVHTWISTFRLGATYPLNTIQTGYFGHPERLDPNIKKEYLDRIGMSYSDCYNRLGNWHSDTVERNKICNRFCTDEVMKKCDGYITDSERLISEAVEKIFAEKPQRDRDCYSGSPLENHDIPEEVEDDNYPINYYNETSNSTEDEMLSWVRSNTQNR